jgi:CubicO group peptidase (beta-lactamase class C family)
MKMSIMRILATLAVFVTPFATAEPSRETVAGKVIEYVQDLAERGFGGGVLIERSGEVLFEGGFGWANREERIPWSVDTVYTVGSITKQFTAHAILKLQEEGKLSVDDPITKWFDGVPVDKQAITIHHLLTHTARIRENFGGDFSPVATRDWMVEKVLHSDLLRGPGVGEAYAYSNAGYSLLGVIVEKASGMGYEQYLWETFFKPLGMTDTGYTLPEWDANRFAHGYVNGDNWGVVALKHALPDGPNWNLRANGGIHSTLRDMHIWYKARREGRVLKPESLTLMESPLVPEDPEGRSHYGYGLVHAITVRGTTFVGHNGGNGIFFADYRQYPDEAVFVLIATNTAADFTDTNYVRGILNAVFPSAQ